MIALYILLAIYLLVGLWLVFTWKYRKSDGTKITIWGHVKSLSFMLFLWPVIYANMEPVDD